MATIPPPPLASFSIALYRPYRQPFLASNSLFLSFTGVVPCSYGHSSPPIPSFHLFTAVVSMFIRPFLTSNSLFFTWLFIMIILRHQTLLCCVISIPPYILHSPPPNSLYVTCSRISNRQHPLAFKRLREASSSHSAPPLRTSVFEISSSSSVIVVIILSFGSSVSFVLSSSSSIIIIIFVVFVDFHCLCFQLSFYRHHTFICWLRGRFTTSPFSTS